ncbi:MAG: selenocysteine-specific translation elongation factor [Firmicutes bacterium]|nr:selenocysteine-specific translation elongation factor [Bacillota bacterium]
MNTKNAIIGTAGHVDHGKTLLIKALTGIETDRLKEEKKRGITIELGFAHLTFEDGTRVGVIDVPGHEKFIRNMLSGAGSIDLALIVIAADEGIMPQTREHLDILSLLGIQNAVVALNKCDLVDDEWLEMMAEDIREEFRKNYPFLVNAEILPVSAYSGKGISELKTLLAKQLKNAKDKKPHIPFRLSIDRVFTKDGFGAVVTGTLIEGELSVSEDAIIYPAMTQVKVRSLQNHTDKVQNIKAGQRAAVNLSGINHNDLKKGDVLAAKNSMVATKYIDVSLSILKSCKREIKNNSRLHFHHGTCDILCKLILIDKQKLSSGETAYAQLQLSEPLAVKTNDKFVLRFYSPTDTIGGGTILDPDAKKFSKARKEEIENFAKKEKGDLKERIAETIYSKSETVPFLEDLKYRFFENSPEFDTCVSALLKDGTIQKVTDTRVVHKKYTEIVGKKAGELLKTYHEKSPLNKGMPRNELWKPLLPKTEAPLTDKLLTLLDSLGLVKITDGQVARIEFSATKNTKHQEISEKVIKILLDAGYATPSYDEIEKPYLKEKKTFKQAFDALTGDGEVIKLTDQIIISKQYFEKAKEVFKALSKEKSVTLGEFRDAIQTSRKYALAIVEYFDLKNLTKKTGDDRIYISD